MTTINLNKFGHFLSGRSLPSQILAVIPEDGLDIELDFTGVSGCNQSFLNELFQLLAARGANVAKIKLVGLAGDPLRHTVEAEIARFIQITRVEPQSKAQ